MTVSTYSIPDIPAKRLLANVILLHEFTRDGQYLADVPPLLATTIGAKSATMVLLKLGPGGFETSRATFPALPAGTTINPHTDWVTALLHARAIDPGNHSSAPFARIEPDGVGQFLYMLGSGHAVAYSIHAPSILQTSEPANTDWLLRILAHVTRNIHERVCRPGPGVLRIAPLSSLTNAEWRVLLALDTDDAEKQIATALAISPHTLHSHIKNIYRKLQVQSRLSAVYCLRRAEHQALITQLGRDLDMADISTSHSSPSEPSAPQSERPKSPFPGNPIMMISPRLPQPFVVRAVGL